MAWRQVATRDQIPAGSGLRVEVDGHPVAIWHTDSGEFYATDDTCTHARASLTEGGLEGHTCICPRHGARFDVRTGAVRALPAVVPLRTYPVRLEGDQIWIEWQD